MKKTIFTTTLFFCYVLILSCGDSGNSSSQKNPVNQANIAITTELQNVSKKATPSSQQSPTQTIKKLAAGEYCYTAKTETLSARAKIKISAASKVNGSVQATIENPAEGYFTSYNQTLTGELEGDKAKLKVITKIENDTQNKQETWIITESSLNTGLESFAKADCGVNDKSPSVEES